MNAIIPRPRFTLSDPFEWLEHSWPFAAMEHPIRIEESVKEDVYELRAELPGFDPDSDITVSAENGLLTISAKRETSEQSEGRSEFHYGTFSRTRTLPAGADTRKISATYQNGILQVTVPYAKQPVSKEVHIKVAKA